MSVVIPARDEAPWIRDCIRAVLAQTWPADRLEVLVADGGSTDGTVEAATAELRESGLSRWEVLDNAAGVTPAGMNLGIAAALGELVVRVDARSRIAPDHVAVCAEVLQADRSVGVAGGRQVAVVADGASWIEVGIARAVNNPFFNGGARYRRRAGGSGPVDTVYLGAFRRADVVELGGYDERYATNQDFELNRRFRRAGSQVWFDDRLDVGYLPRPSLGALARQYWRFGRWKARDWRMSGGRPERRQLVLLAAPWFALGATVLGLVRRPLTTAATGLATLIVLEAATRRPSPNPPGARIAGAIAGVVMSGCWWVGAWTGVFGQARSCDASSRYRSTTASTLRPKS